MGTVLVVDDEPNIRTILERRLERAGFRALTTSSAVAGLEVLLAESVQLLVLDVRLPDADGVECLPRLREAASGAPVIVITAYEEEGLSARAKEAGAAEVLIKPFDLEAFVETAYRLTAAAVRSGPGAGSAPGTAGFR
jgi:DNA-binding response OmpR family regulator